MLLIGSGGSTMCTGKKFSLAKQKQFPTYKLVILRNSCQLVVRNVECIFLYNGG